jgi:hypothetical protein
VTALRGIALTARFLCELAMLGGLAYWGFEAAGGAWAWVLGLGAPVLAAAIWGAFVAPKAKLPVSTPIRLAIELLLFGSTVIGLAIVGRHVFAVVLAVAAGSTSLLSASRLLEPT